MSLTGAGAGEVLRSVQKDELYSGQLARLVCGLGLDMCGPAAWLHLDSWAEPAVRESRIITAWGVKKGQMKRHFLKRTTLIGKILM
jgi:hypothetical protein